MAGVWPQYGGQGLSITRGYLGRGPQGQEWICDCAWPGVKVVEGPISDGIHDVLVAVEPGAQLVVSGSSVPWTTTLAQLEIVARAHVAEQLTLEFT